MQNDDYLATVNRICRAVLYKKTHTFPTEKVQIFYGVPGFLDDQIQGSGVQFMKENKRYKDCKKGYSFCAHTEVTLL